MSESRQSKQADQNDTSTTSCSSLARESGKEVTPITANVKSVPLSPVFRRDEPRQKLLYWSGQEYRVGECTIQPIRMFFWSDGRTRFEAYVKSDGTGDVFVFYDGIAIKDSNGVELWRSGKLVGPEMIFEGQYTNWNADFFYPAMWFDSIAQAQIVTWHC